MAVQHSPLDKSLSDTELEVPRGDATPSNFACARTKRSRDDVRNEEFNSSIVSLTDEMKKLFSAQDIKLQKISETQKEIRESNLNTEKSIAMLTAQNEEFKRRIEALETRSKEDRLHIATLENKLEDLQRSSRKNNFEIKNVNKQDGESQQDLLAMVSCLAQNVGCNVEKGDIKDIYRVPAKKEKSSNTPIVVEMSSTLLKSDLLKKCKDHNRKNKDNKLCAKHLGLRISEDDPVFVSEQLTAKGSRLFFLARDLAKSKVYKYCWTSFGKVYVRKDDTSPYIVISSESQVHQLSQ